ncbi:MAG: arylsulfatase [Planctomycetota bacterium]
MGLVALLCCVPLLQEPALQPPPNIVLILADDLGWGEVGCYGQTKIRTPQIDRLAQEGLRLTHFYSGAPVCAPARCVLLTGEPLPTAQIRDNKDFPGAEGQWPLEAGTRTLAGYLQSAGYGTGGFGKWGLGNAGNSGNPNRLGFDEFYGYYCQRVAHSYFPPYLNHNDRREVLNRAPVPGHKRLDEDVQPGDVDFAVFQGQVYAPDRILDEALQFVREHEDRPFFLYLPFVEPHVAMQPPGEWVDRYPREWDTEPYMGRRGYLPHPRPHAGYAAMISHLDDHVGRVLAQLDAAGLRENTLVVFTSDNGPTHDVGGVDTGFFDSSGGLRGRKGSVYEGGLRVPCVVRWPGKVPAGTVSDVKGAFPDLLPTLCAAAGVALPTAPPGENLLPYWTGAQPGPRRTPLLWEFHGYGGQQALIFPDGFKAVRRGLAKEAQAWQLFDLNKDPGETQDLAAQFPVRVAEAERILLERRTVSEVFPLPVLDKDTPKRD